MPWLLGDPWLGTQGSPAVVIPPPSFNLNQPWLGTDGIPDPTFTGSTGASIATLALDKVSIEVTGWFVNWLSIPSRWEVQRTEGTTPLVIPEEKVRWVSLTRRDVILVRTDSEPSEVVGIENNFTNDIDYVHFTILTRKSRMHCHLLREELTRQLQFIRRDTFGVDLPGEGRNWLKVTQVDRSERSFRAMYRTTVTIEVSRRWKPIVVTR